MIDAQFRDGRGLLIAQSEGHEDYGRYETPAPALRAAEREFQDIVSLRQNEHFEHAWISRVLACVADPSVPAAVRRYLSQGLDEAAVERGLLLQPHWHCPQCGSPGSQWGPGCALAYCPHEPPVRRSHWDYCRVAARHELLTLVVSEGYDRVGALAGAAELLSLNAAWRRFVPRLPEPLSSELQDWVRDVHDAHAARAAEILDVSARLGNALDLRGPLDPERLLADALHFTGLDSSQPSPRLQGAKESR